MITTNNLQELLTRIGFEQLKGRNSGIWRKEFSTCELSVNFNTNTLVYPEDTGFIVKNRTTCNFSDPENFVVFDCVCRLLSKGYKPEHIELEPRWTVGHGPSGGRADILVKDNSGKAYLIIECKTWGDEFDTAWKLMNLTGGQLFTYAQQITSTQFLCLYASNYDDGKRLYINHIITLRDNPEYLKSLKNPLSFADATDVPTMYRAWYDTYNHEYETTGIFEDVHATYEIGKAKRTAADLQEINHDDIQKKYHEFATILRQHNVSGRENAFDKLVNLFLAKIVDEMQEADELMFYWRGVAFDNYYDLQDRIQRLYRDGMQKFLNEEVTYIDNNDIKKAFRLFKSDPDATRSQIEGYFRQLKFYTNNDFAFLDVHNQHLFVQNSAVLLKIVRMLQDIKLKTEEQNQFLGDLFEGFLDQGVKQSEGQFFTPTPIVKFLVSALPLKTLIDDNAEPLRVIDYACGAGHFLNEYATQIQSFLPTELLTEYYKLIFGIEKEYRLSKVAKVSAFMYGQDEIQIIYADALSENSNIENGSYNVLVSNPPYSVRGFLETLTAEERASFETIKIIDTKSIITNNAIEVFFIERAKQLLAPGGVAAIILPSSILSKSAGVYTKAREIILQYFDIVAIAEFGSGTFGKTGTSTVTMFLRRKAENPSIAEHYRNRVNSWFNNDFDKDDVFEDSNVLAAYCAHVEFTLDDYKTLLSSLPNIAFLETDTIKTYRSAFENLTETKNRIKQRTFKALSIDEKKAELDKRFTTYMRDIEKDKLYYFMLAYSNPQDVVVAKSPPSKGGELKKFLGYGWSGRKGNEGIQYIGINAEESESDDASDKDMKEAISRLKGIKSINTPLFNPNDLTDESKINSIIRANFNGVASSDSEFVSRYRLVDMLDFNGVKFEKQISLTAAQTVQVDSKYPVEKLDRIAIFNPSKIEISDLSDDTIISFIEMASLSNNGYIENKVDRPLHDVINGGYTFFRDEDIIIAKITPCFENGKCALTTKLTNGIGFGSSEFHVIRCGEQIINRYLFAYLNRSIVRQIGASQMTGASGHRRVPDTFYKYLQIPIPPHDIQKEIVAACEAVDAEYEHTRMSIEEHRGRIEEILSSMEIDSNVEGYSLSDSTRFVLSIGKRILDTQLISDGETPVYSANVFEPFGYINERLIVDFNTPSVLWGIDGDWQVNYIPAENEFYPTDHCGVLRVLSNDIHPRCLAWALHKAGKERGFTRTLRASIDRIKRLTVNLPPIEKQKEIADKVFAIEAKITTAKETIKRLDGKRESILIEYLK